jgi:hypothetical protein
MPSPSLSFSLLDDRPLSYLVFCLLPLLSASTFCFLLCLLLIFSSILLFSSVTDEEKLELKEIKVSSFLNIAMCCLKLNENQKAIDMCKKVLELDEKNVKALFR